MRWNWLATTPSPAGNFGRPTGPTIKRSIAPCRSRSTTGRIFLSSGYAAGSARFQVQRVGEEWKVAELWKNKNQFKLKFQDGILKDGHVYAIDEGILSCLDVSDGKRKWKRGRYGFGQVLLIEDDELLLVQSETGTIHLVEAQPTGFTELTSFPALQGTCWNQPVVHRGRLYVRSEKEAACYDIGASP